MALISVECFTFSIKLMSRYYFTDYMQVWWVQVREEVVCMEGAFVDVVTGKLTSSYLEAGFEWFYGLVSGEWCENERLVEVLLRLVNSPDRRAFVDLGKEVEALHSMVFRLSKLVGEADDGTEVEYGYFIEDGFPFGGSFSSVQFTRLLIPFGERRLNHGLLRKTKFAMRHLTVLAMRYEYYSAATRYGVSERLAREYSELEDDDMLNSAKWISRLIEEVQFERWE